MLNAERLDSIPAGDNPFRYDHYHMGTHIGTNVLIMHPNHTSEVCDYIIICNIDTGERYRVPMTLKGCDKGIGESLLGRVLK